jgi:glycosyltransferase involved in cell wall biosynthesis
MKASELIADGQFDIVHVEHLRGARMGLAIMAGNKRVENHTPIVWDSVDNIAHLFRQAATKSRKITSRLLTAFELGRTERYEGWLLHQFDHTLVTSNNDREAFLRQTKDRVLDERITVVNNGVDLNYFQPPKGHIRNAKTLVMSGKLSYHANVNMVLYMVRDIMPLIWKEEPNVCLVIVGKDPPEEIRSLAGDPRIEVTGTVRDIRPYLQKATIAVAPITYGAGIQNKVLEAMACATPVVSTPQAVSALAVEPGENVLIGADATAFAAQVIRLLKDEPLRDKIGQAGRQYVEDYHSWDKLIGRLVDIYQMVIESTRGTAENLKAEHPT